MMIDDHGIKLLALDHLVNTIKRRVDGGVPESQEPILLVLVHAAQRLLAPKHAQRPQTKTPLAISRTNKSFFYTISASLSFGALETTESRMFLNMAVFNSQYNPRTLSMTYRICG